MSEQLDTKTLKNVYFYYSRVDEPVMTKKAKDAGYQQDPDNPMKNMEWQVKIIVSEEYFKKMKKNPAMKGAKNFVNAKEYTIAEFEEKFHAEEKENMPDFGDAEDVVLIKFSQKCQNTSGKNNQPPTLIGIKGKVMDNNDIPIKQQTLLGNGTAGMLQIRPVDFGVDHGLYLYPNAICVTELVEYVGSSSHEVDYDAFGIEELSEEDKEVAGEDDEFDEDIGF